ILVGGGAASDLLPSFGVARYTPSGDLDLNWGTGGVSVTPYSGFDLGNTLALQVDGRVLLGGYFLVQGEGGLLARYEGDIGAPPLCGNGDLDPEEECDDGNTASGDCCSSSCTLDPVGTACGPTFACSGFVCD